MAANSLLLKQEYDKINWQDHYPTFRRQALPNTIRHVVLETFPVASVVIESGDLAQTLVKPSLAAHLKTEQRADTLFVKFMPPGQLSPNEFDPRSLLDFPKEGIGLVLRLPALHSLKATDSWVSLKQFRPETLSINLQHSRLETVGIATSGRCDILARRDSWVQLGSERFGALAVTVQDASLLQLRGTTAGVFSKTLSPSASVSLQGAALGLLK
jgi:hypothetical protein